MKTIILLLFTVGSVGDHSEKCSELTIDLLRKKINGTRKRKSVEPEEANDV